ncbi:3'-5' exoribonuclease [Luteibacter sp. PPL201]|uniref:3'-5' exoribonuclease n=1 Tax=Luteibacter sahnii TaxID=3021977 RepID=A0ABT6BGW8_9GAMM|nr:3'-5' exoribonuclease [Luteibacter sp. PPL193]MDY1548883.1 3'-5' exoribonuclease [Luteibacter sp. PPL193]
MDLFLDCEWADTLASELVSIALISLNGKKIFYAERDPLPSDPIPWTRTVVYPLLERGASAKSDADMTRALREFLADIDSPRILYDFGADRSLCQYVIDGFEVPDPSGPLPLGLEWRLCDELRADVERWWSSNRDQALRRHHALVDAQALRAAYMNRNHC